MTASIEGGWPPGPNFGDTLQRAIWDLGTWGEPVYYKKNRGDPFIAILERPGSSKYEGPSLANQK